MTDQTLGRYAVQSELGHGAMGIVYKATDPLLDRTVALKTINLSLSKEEIEDFEQRFYREAKSAGRLNHPNIVTIYDIGRTDSLAYLAMEYIEGQSLRETLDSGSALPIDRIAEIGAQIADGLAAAHAAEVVHRDIKPANIMITRAGQAKIMDFGVALIPSASRTQAGTILGSPKYMSPEHVVGHRVDGRSDIFSLGSVIYEMLAGRAPFTGENISAVMYKVINDSAPPPSAFRPEVPASLDYIVAKATAKHPDDRYAKAEEMSRDLRNFRSLQPQSVTVNRHGTLERRGERRPEERDGDHTVIISPEPAPDSGAAPAPAGAAAKPPATRVVVALAGLALVAGVAAFFILGGKPSGEALPPPPPVAAAMPPVAPEPVATTPVLSPPAETKHAETAPARPKPAAKPVAAPAKATTAPTAPPAAKPDVATGTLELSISPSGEIHVDGKMRGTSPPMKKIELPAGKHDLTIYGSEGFPFVTKIEIKPGETLRITRSFP